ncbi:hypothetical protein F2Q69_00027309 [Brassica cretica]|uniref:Uncharacterized protein n=1 Tax=Brassica cretica TaxID=69181 RepID=A0A8S9RWH7_BRACR|nr:hypothetical protein F2Q69_00027309 [Brassica cretica]
MNRFARISPGNTCSFPSSSSTELNFSLKPPESPGTTTTKETSNDYVGRSQTTEHKTETSTPSDLNRKPFKTTTPVPADITKVKVSRRNQQASHIVLWKPLYAGTKARTSGNLHRN